MEYKQESVVQLHARKNALVYALACVSNRGGKSRVVKTTKNCENGWFFN